ncbi:hypothetical protein [Petrachloros mirabilis]
MMTLRHFTHWLAQYPLGVATLLYAAAVCAVLVHAYFEHRAQR